MAYAYLFKYIIIGDTASYPDEGQAVNLQCGSRCMSNAAVRAVI